MGFPVGYTELLLPKFFLHVLSLLFLITKLTTSLFRHLGLSYFLDPADISSNPASPASSSSSSVGAASEEEFSVSVSGVLLREVLPVVKFSELADPTADSCAVCLADFAGDDETRPLANCRHVFHRACLDRWMGYDRKTCPLCRSPVVPEEVQEAFNERLWASFGISDWYTGELSQQTAL